jgi:hypothetical protein
MGRLLFVVLISYVGFQSIAQADNYFPARFECSADGYTFYVGANCDGCTVLDFPKAKKPKRKRYYGGFHSCSYQNAWRPERSAYCSIEAEFHDPTHGDYRISHYIYYMKYTERPETATVWLTYVPVVGRAKELLKEVNCEIKPWSHFPNHP